MSTGKAKPARVVTCEKITFKEGIMVEEYAPHTPDSNQPRLTTISQQPSIVDMPDDVLYLLFTHIVTNLSLKELVSLSNTCHRLFNLVFNNSNSTTADWNKLWRSIFSKRWPISSIQRQASFLAGSWQCLYKEKHTVEIAEQHVGGPFWSKAAPMEIKAFVHSFFHHHTNTSSSSSTITPETESCTNPTTANTTSPLSSPSHFIIINTDTSITFLVDGSGSVTLEDFRHIQDFIITTHNIITSQLTNNHQNKVYMSVVQFSNDYRIELSPMEITPPPPHPHHHPHHHHRGIEEEVGNMKRMTGGTHVGAAMRGAHRVIKSLPGGGGGGGGGINSGENDGPSSAHPPSPFSNTIIPRKVLVLITDGRIDTFQLQEAADMVQRMREEEEERRGGGGGGGGGEVVVKVVGVGRGVNEGAMLTLVGGERPEDNYLGLCTLDELVW